jgi:hypothetical protein
MVELRMVPGLVAMRAACVLATPLVGCAAAIIAAVPINIVTTEVIPRAVNGKGLVEDGVDLATGKDCRVLEGAVRDDRKICEPRGSPATKKDFKGISGLLNRGDEDAR